MLCGLALSLAAYSSALPQSARQSGTPVSAPGPKIEKLSNGLELLTLSDGRKFFTHGPDPKPSFGDPSMFDISRPPVCATSNYQQVLYGHLSALPNRIDEVAGDIRAAVKNMNALLNKEAVASGNVNADYKVLCDESGEVSIGEFTSLSPDYVSVFDAAAAAGFNDPDTKYSIFFDFEGGVCGVGTFNEDESPGAGNKNNSGGYAVSYDSCWFDRTPMHENGHNMGAVQPDAPYSTGSGGHCYEDDDVMCYSPDGGDKHQEGTVMNCPGRVYYDCGYDTYFDAAPEAGEFLYDHWNIGSRVNEYIQFGETPTPPPPPPVGNQPPGGTFSRSCINETCRFTAYTWDDSEVNSVVWDFDDGTRSGKRSPTHTYSVAGVHTVTLTVTDDEFLSSQAVKTVKVYTPDPDLSVTTLWGQGWLDENAPPTDKWMYYKIQVPQGARDLRFTLDTYCSLCQPATQPALIPCLIECMPNFDLFIKKGSIPTQQDFDCSSRHQPQLVLSSQEYETCDLGDLNEGFYYIGIRNVSAAEGEDLELYWSYDDSDGHNYGYYY